MINKGLMSSNKNYWETPNNFFNNLNSKYNFRWDLAASDSNHKCSNYYTEEQNSLEQDWTILSGNLFLNPPYGRDLKCWVKKAYESSLYTDSKIVLLIPARTDTSYWHDYIFDKADVYFIRGRLKFEINGEAKDAAPFPSAVVVYDRLNKNKNFRNKISSILGKCIE